MPTKRMKVTRNIKSEVSRFAMRMISDDLFCPKAEPISFEDDRLQYLTIYPEPCAALWKEYGQAVVQAWAERRPGSRPRWFWLFPEPRYRERLGGTGFPKSDFLAHLPTFSYGIPADWITSEDVETWPHLAGRQIGATDPPIFESQAAFLKRLNLLLPGEEEKIKRRHWQPERIEEEEP